MKYHQVEKAVFLERPNRFIAYVDKEGRREICHVKNTGRCRELLIPGAVVYLEKSENPDRKTAYDLIAVKKNGQIINMDSQAPNHAAAEWLRGGGMFCETKPFKEGDIIVRPETKYGSSRFDLYAETSDQKLFMEVKGVTLEENGIARFPDAPTERGVRHVRELMACREDGYEAYLLFVIQMKGIRSFEPNDRTHPDFGVVLREAQKNGVHILAYDCLVTEDSMKIDRPVPVNLGEPVHSTQKKGGA